MSSVKWLLGRCAWLCRTRDREVAGSRLTHCTAKLPSTTLGSRLHMHLSVTKQYHFVLVVGRWSWEGNRGPGISLAMKSCCCLSEAVGNREQSSLGTKRGGSWMLRFWPPFQHYSRDCRTEKLTGRKTVRGSFNVLELVFFLSKNAVNNTSCFLRFFGGPNC